MPGIGLERADQLQIETPMILEKLRERLWCLHLRQPVLAALLGSFDRDGLPLGLLGHGAFVIQTDNRPIGKNWSDFRGADFNGFLHDQIHVFSFGNGLAKGDATAQRWRMRVVQFAEMDLRRVARNDLGGDLASVPVKENNPVRRVEAQDVAAMMRFGARQNESVGVPIFRRDIKAMHAGQQKFLDFSRNDKNGLPKEFLRAIEEALAERSVFVAAESGKFFEFLALLAVQTARHLD